MANQDWRAKPPCRDNLMQVSDIMPSTVGPFASPGAVSMAALV
jgi:hypothetical protein